MTAATSSSRSTRSRPPRGRHHRLRHGARLRRQREPRGSRSPARGAPDGADRDQGRHEPGRRQMDPGRPRQDDPRGLRSQPRRARRPGDRPLPDPCARSGTPWKTSVRALARLVDEGLVKRVGVANVNRRQLDEALELAPVAAVQVALSVFDDTAIRGGMVERCEEAGIALIAHSPLGGPRRSGRLARRGPGRGRARLAARALPRRRRDPRRSPPGDGPLGRPSREAPSQRRRPGSARQGVQPKRRARRRGDGDIVLVMGIPGAGKSRIAEEYVARGYVRLNRDERGGSLRDIAAALDESSRPASGRSSSTTRTSHGPRGAT